MGGGECRFPPRWLCGSLTPVHSWQRQLVGLLGPAPRPQGREGRQVALPELRQMQGARKVREWEFQGPGAGGPGR